ncbi:MAG: FhaA domain-containing protein [Chloroflexota bacterium]|jgi:hypothetical protein
MKEVTFLEKLAENLLEGSFNRILKPKLQPVQIAKALAREMERNQMVGTEGPLAPNLFVTYLHPDDLASLASFQSSLERELENYLTGFASRHGLKLLSPPQVKLISGEVRVRMGRVKVESSLIDTPAKPATEDDRDLQPGWEGTAELPAAIVEPPFHQPTPNIETREAVLVDETGQEIPLSHGETNLGRAVNNDIVIESRDVSRQHAKIVREGNEYVVVDLGSTNGSFADGRRITRQTLSDGSVISLGTTTFTFRLVDPQPER